MAKPNGWFQSQSYSSSQSQLQYNQEIQQPQQQWFSTQVYDQHTMSHTSSNSIANALTSSNSGNGNYNLDNIENLTPLDETTKLALPDSPLNMFRGRNQLSNYNSNNNNNNGYNNGYNNGDNNKMHDSDSNSNSFENDNHGINNANNNGNNNNNNVVINVVGEPDFPDSTLNSIYDNYGSGNYNDNINDYYNGYDNRNDNYGYNGYNDGNNRYANGNDNDGYYYNDNDQYYGKNGKYSTYNVNSKSHLNQSPKTYKKQNQWRNQSRNQNSGNINYGKNNGYNNYNNYNKHKRHGYNNKYQRNSPIAKNKRNQRQNWSNYGSPTNKKSNYNNDNNYYDNDDENSTVAVKKQHNEKTWNGDTRGRQLNYIGQRQNNVSKDGIRDKSDQNTANYNGSFLMKKQYRKEISSLNGGSYFYLPQRRIDRKTPKKVNKDHLNNKSISQMKHLKLSQKLEKCNDFFDYGICREGSNCINSHLPDYFDYRLRVSNYKCQPCTDHCIGEQCMHGKKCNFAHSGEPLRRPTTRKYYDKEYLRLLVRDFPMYQYPFGMPM